METQGVLYKIQGELYFAPKILKNAESTARLKEAYDQRVALLATSPQSYRNSCYT